jgi:hypothetical protein
MSIPEHHGSAGPAELYRQAQELMRAAREKLTAARLAGLETPTDENWPDLVDFDALPGRSPHGRAEALYMGRRIRDGMFPRDLFGELAWDILLEIFLVKGSSEGLAIVALCTFAPHLRETIVRYVDLMIEQGVLQTSAQADVQGRVLISLSPRGREVMSNFFVLTDGQMAAASVANTSTSNDGSPTRPWL